HYPHQWKPYDLVDIDFLSAVRKGDWKLVYRMRTGKLELYNLKTDIGEKNDLSAVYPERVRELATELSSKLRGWNSPMPRLREKGMSVPLPDELL
ncbi:MAG: sulfatase, partial [Alistipes sp.]|nr:sulfatase [Alistipes sp.]